MRKLNVQEIFNRVIGLFFNFSFLTRATGLWFGVIFAGSLLTRSMVTRQGVPFHPMPGFEPLLWGLWIVGAIAFAACAVNVHRFVLLGDRPAILRVSGTEGRYILRGIRVFLPLIIVVVSIEFALLIVMIASGSTDSWLTWIRESPLWYFRLVTYGMLALLAPILVVPRSLTLPAIAIGKKEFSVEDSKKIVRQNRASLSLLYIVLLAATVALRFVNDAVDNGAGPFGVSTNPVVAIAHTLFASAISIADVVLWAAALSMAYAGLVEGRAEYAEERGAS